MTISQRFATLKDSERAILHHAHDQEIAQFIEYMPGRYIGCFAQYISYLQPELTHGNWSTGTIITALRPSEFQHA